MQMARRFLIASVCTFILLVGTAASAQETALSAKLLPNDTEMIFTTNLQQILKSEVLKDKKEIIGAAKAAVAGALEQKGVDKYLKTAGFDVFTDLTSLTVAVPGGRNPEESFIIVTGAFDADKIETAVLEASKEAGGGAKLTKLANVKVFELSPKGEKSIFVGILDKKTMVVCATKNDFTDTVARFNGTKTSKMKAEFKALLDTVNSKQSLSIVATTAVLGKLAENLPEGAADKAKAGAAALQQVEGLSFAITIQKNVDFQIGVNAKDAKTAADIAAKGNLGIGFLKATVAEKAKQDEKFAPAAEVVNTIRLTATGSNLLIRGQVSYETLGKILTNLPNLQLPKNQ